MKKLKKIIIKSHRILGSILSLVFLVWFISGFVMIYSGFPKPDKEKAFVAQESLSKYADKIKSLSIDSIAPQNATLAVLHQKPVYLHRYKAIDATTLSPVSSFKTEALDNLIKKNYKANIKKKKIINDYDSWIPWARYSNYFPIHKYYLDDKEKTVVYLSEKTGTVVQETTEKKRWLARFGAIPHWLYFKDLRVNQGLWSQVVIWLSGIGSIMCLLGLVVGIYQSRKWRKAKKKGLFGISPYKKKWFRWHHIVGMTFGVFVFTFVFSGMMSMMSVPQWVISQKKEINFRKMWYEPANTIEQFTLPLADLLTNKEFQDIKTIQFRKFNNTPYYLFQKKYKKPIWIDASNTDAKQKEFSEGEILDLAKKKFKEHKFSHEIINETDGYYNTSEKIIKLKFNDTDKSWFYIPVENPINTRLYDKNRRLGRWLYKGLHTFNFPAFEGIEWLRKTMLIILSVFGTIVSLTGVVLGYRYFRRKAKKLRN
ncbi:PepSY-associated transmembrane protein [Balneicella halophila]|uniref:PepSY-associated transmembrane protein n=1 Tax=Balneicella halophila TaxID=1537566 RepID=A0A7L4UNU0_BALHA|nr:PepSY domain-containing protein [Balneicella halophila]PVX49998.1 PepSY-associated transmembrane protein [Balneicella halophila]